MRLLLVMLMCSAAAQAGVYRWVDAGGEVHFSDHPVPQAQKIRVVGDSPASPAKPQTDSAGRGKAGDSGGRGSVYTDFELLEPESDHSYRSSEGRVPVSLLLRPGLQKGDRIRLTVDGVQLAERFTTTQLTLDKLSRGTHSLQVEVVDAEGHVVQAASPPVSFHVRRSPEQLPTP
jgi:Domain of unknown function (DUF4124)